MIRITLDAKAVASLIEDDSEFGVQLKTAVMNAATELKMAEYANEICPKIIRKTFKDILHKEIAVYEDSWARVPSVKLADPLINSLKKTVLNITNSVIDEKMGDAQIKQLVEETVDKRLLPETKEMIVKEVNKALKRGLEEINKSINESVTE